MFHQFLCPACCSITILATRTDPVPTQWCLFILRFGRRPVPQKERPARTQLLVRCDVHGPHPWSSQLHWWTPIISALLENVDLQKASGTGCMRLAHFHNTVAQPLQKDAIKWLAYPWDLVLHSFLWSVCGVSTVHFWHTCKYRAMKMTSVWNVLAYAQLSVILEFGHLWVLFGFDLLLIHLDNQWYKESWILPSFPDLILQSYWMQLHIFVFRVSFPRLAVEGLAILELEACERVRHWIKSRCWNRGRLGPEQVEMSVFWEHNQLKTELELSLVFHTFSLLFHLIMECCFTLRVGLTITYSMNVRISSPPSPLVKPPIILSFDSYSFSHSYLYSYSHSLDDARAILS